MPAGRRERDSHIKSVQQGEEIDLFFPVLQQILCVATNIVCCNKHAITLPSVSKALTELVHY